MLSSWEVSAALKTRIMGRGKNPEVNDNVEKVVDDQNVVSCTWMGKLLRPIVL